MKVGQVYIRDLTGDKLLHDIFISFVILYRNITKDKEQFKTWTDKITAAYSVKKRKEFLWSSWWPKLGIVNGGITVL